MQMLNRPSICRIDKFIITIMDEDDAFFEVDQEEEEIREITLISHSALNYEPRITNKPKIPLKSPSPYPG